MPAHIVFGDATLRDRARQRPSTPAGLLEVRGVGQKKLADVGQVFLECISNFCREHGIEIDKAATAVVAWPIFDELDGRVGYDRIRIALACLANHEASASSVAND